MEVYDLDLLQENYQIKNSNKRLDSPTEDHVTCQQSPQRQRLVVKRKEESATKGHI
jgi:hypothetical protein